MKFTLAVVLTMVTTASAAVAQPHAHQHRHQDKRAMATMYTGTKTVDVFELNGTPIPIAEVCLGIASGSLRWGGSPPPHICSPASTSTSSTSSWTSSSSSSVATATHSPTWTLSAVPTSKAGGEFYPEKTASAAWSGWAPQSSSTNSGTGGSGVTSSFPDGQLSCSTFPSEYGAVNIDYMGLGGWIGIQTPGSASGGFSKIVTATSGGCTEGSYCSYACPPGYQKSQWPTMQGSTGQSVGGILCQGGMLRMTNSALSSNLCIPGTGNVQATNIASSIIAICRTDYPGSESETVPIELQPGATQPLTCPDCSTYYKWQGSSTSAQYYLNPPGIPASTACRWGRHGGDTGNYAPINLGVGACSGTTWLSIIPNTPTTDATYPGTVEIQGNLSGSCKYENGQFCSASGCGSSGCTVSLLSGTATYVIS